MTDKVSFDLSKFKRLEKIGHGAFFNVYKIIEEGTGSIYTAKIFLRDFDESDTDEQHRITNMLTIIKSINHPSILKFIGFSPVDFKGKKRPTFVTEFMPNGSLGRIIDLCTSSLSPNEWNSTKILINIYGIAAAMSYLHSNNILHLDIKPENILLDDSFYPKLCDFYLSTFEDTLPKAVVGTPLYISPEIFNKHAYSKASDVYAFGFLVYQLITNEKPFKQYNFYELLLKVTQGVRPDIPPEVPEQYKKLIESCWANNPSDRPTFDDILKQLTENKGFITDNVDEDEFYKYVDDIESNQTSFNLQKERPNMYSKSESIFIDKAEEERKYELVSKIGEGADFIATKLIDKETRRSICRKFLKVDQLSTKNRENKLKEFEINCSIHHPSICKAYFIDKSLFYIFVEYLDYDLKGFLSSDYCSNTMKAKIIVEISHAINFLHKKRMIHKRISIDNIRLNSALEAKLTNVGCVDNSAKGVGTLAYMSPELVNEEEYDNKTDVYSFGVVLYFIAFNGLPKQSLKEKASFKPVKIPTEHPNASSFFIHLIEKCLEPEHSERPSFEDILDELRKNSFQIADDVDTEVVSQRDKQLDLI